MKQKNFWSLARVIELYKADDNLIRSARIQKADGSQLKTAIIILYPLELKVAADNQINPNTSPIREEEPPVEVGQNLSSLEQTERPKRRAKTSFLQKLGGWVDDDLV